ncbi:MAG TPA: hypothetical protein VME40_13650 [Caulobacteraceae bacterium]|nr:hypothetical protein [Caulobacteraceae bacterium]
MTLVSDPRRAGYLVALLGAALCLSACGRRDNSYDNAINSAQAEANAEQKTMDSPEAQVGANMALAPLPNSAGPGANSAP